MDEIQTGNVKLAESRVRSISGSMMFSGDDSKKKVSLLSGGEKSRVMLGKILAKDVNILFLDEPTNHLDMESIDSLTTAIENFDGSCIVVTHSEELLRRVCDRLIIFSKGGADYFDGRYDDFLSKIGWEEEEGEVKVKAKPKVNKKENKKKRTALLSERNKLTSALKKKVEKFETQIMEIEDLIESEQHELVQASNAGDNAKVMELSKTVKVNQSKIDEIFAALEIDQLKIDEILEEYNAKIEKLQ
jgi:ATP-binding cassette subfamily F protein 3